jgi:hypothetical protein
VVCRRLLLIALLALVSVAGVAGASAMANTGAPTLPAEVTAPVLPGPHAGTGGHATSDGPCVQRASCAGGALLAGAAMLLFLPAAGIALPGPVPVAPVAAAPAPLRSALLARKLFRPPQPS